MIDRLKKLMNEKNLSATQFSEEVGIQRSALSHVLSGRNKPSLDFMLKVKNQYQEIELDWLLLGKGKMIKKEEPVQPSPEKITEEVQPEINFTEEKTIEDLRKEESGSKIAEIQNVSSKIETSGLKKGEKPTHILIMYADNTFETFTPKQ